MELYIQPERLTVNPTNGRFLKGHIPHNKGKKWREYLDMRKAKRIMKNLELGRKNGNPMVSGWNRKAVIGIKDGRIIGVFESSNEAGRKLGICSRNIRSCCNGSRKRCGGVYWFWENGADWMKLITPVEK